MLNGLSCSARQLATAEKKGKAPMNEEIKQGQRRSHHLRVPVLATEKEVIEANAAKAGLSVASYLRRVGQGYTPNSVIDYQRVMELGKINGDLGRLGGLLKLWLSNDERVDFIGSDTIRAALKKIEERQDQMADVMTEIVEALP